MRLYYTGSSHTGGFPLLPEKKALTHNKNRKIESARVEAHHKRTGGGADSGPPLPPHPASPRSERAWGVGGALRRPVRRVGIHYCHQRRASCRSQHQEVFENAGNATGCAGPLQSALGVSGLVMMVGGWTWI